MDLQRCNGVHGDFGEPQVVILTSTTAHNADIYTNSVALYLASLAEVGQGRTLTRVEIAAIAWGVNIASGIINTVGTKAIGAMSTFNLWWTLGGTLVLVVTLLVKAPTKVRLTFSHLCIPPVIDIVVEYRTRLSLFSPITRSTSCKSWGPRRRLHLNLRVPISQLHRLV